MKLAHSILAAVAVFAASAAFAAPPETVTLKAKQGDITFNHKAHQKQGCKNCHGPGKPEKIKFENKEQAHKLCAGCHDEKKQGPQAKDCTGCHKKA